MNPTLRENGGTSTSSSNASPNGVVFNRVSDVGHKFHEVFQVKQGCYADLPPAKLSEMMKSNSLDNAPTQSLLSVVNGILDESFERGNGEIPHRVALLLRKVIMEIERRISTQAEHLRAQNYLIKAREEKYQSRIKVLEALSAATANEEIKAEKTKTEEKKMVENEDMIRLAMENNHNKQEISALKQELQIEKRTYELRYLQIETEYRGTKEKLEGKIKQLEHLLVHSGNRVKELEASSALNTKDHSYKSVMDFQLGALQELRFLSECIKQEILNAQLSYSQDFNRLDVKIKAVQDLTENYNVLLAENRTMYNEIQDLKGNIRVSCRIRPFLPRQKDKQTIVEYIGDNGELGIANPSKQGKECQKAFKFNKVFGPAATQEEVYSDIQPLIRSVLDGYNVCIFAYGQTGSGKTYTMTGPSVTAGKEESLGVNYRALNDLFSISQNRSSFVMYEIGVQMVEIYNEQVRDLLSSDGSPKKLGILTNAQPCGLALPDASMNPVKSTSDVVELMDIGLKNRAVGATAMNERSSRSHSVTTVHVRGTDLKTGTTLYGNLHLVDLAGSERVDRTEATGNRLNESKHINKSLSALGDVVFALAQKSPHVPYRNSKLTQVLQSSLGGQAKTLMFVQLNPDVDSFAESLSTSKFAERVSGVELGAARSSKEGRDVRDLMEKVASLKSTISRKNEEIERLKLLKDQKYVEKNGTGSFRSGSSSPIQKDRTGSYRSGSCSPTEKPPSSCGSKVSGLIAERSDSENEIFSVVTDMQSEARDSRDFPTPKEFFQPSKFPNRGEIRPNTLAVAENLGFEGVSGLSVGTDFDSSSDHSLDKTKSESLAPRVLRKSRQTASPAKTLSSTRKSINGPKTSTTSRRWQ